MTARHTLPLFSLFLLAACSSAPNGGVAESTASVGQAIRSNDGERGDDNGDRAAVRHVLLISVDGLHEVDVARFVASHHSSTFAQLVSTGVEYTDAHTPTPSDSFPGLTALITGGSPKTTGVYYDDSYDRTYYSPSSNCTGPQGVEATNFEILATDFTQIFSPINPANLPMQRNADGTCTPVYPHNFVKVNTVFEVIRAAGGYTAWSDKHAAYDLANGPSGKGVIDLYSPEINSLVVNGGVVNGVDLTGSLALCDGVTNSLPLKQLSDYTTCEPTVIAYDDTKVQAVVNEINGKTSDGTKSAPIPTILGMNFQQVSVGQKLPPGGYADANGTPSALLEGALEHVDQSLDRMVDALKANHLYESTLIIVTAKHGQSPVDKSKLAMEAGGSGNATVTDPVGYINAVDPGIDNNVSTFVNSNGNYSPFIGGYFQTDDIGLLWLQDQSPAHVAAVVAQLTDPAHRAAMFADKLPPGTIFDSNINHGAELAAIYGDPTSGDPVAAARAPNVVIQPNWGVIYSGSSKKLAEHGGGTLDDTHVALLVSNPQIRGHKVGAHVFTKQVAPTLLRSLGLDSDALEAVRKEHTDALPGLKF